MDVIDNGIVNGKRQWTFPNGYTFRVDDPYTLYAKHILPDGAEEYVPVGGLDMMPLLYTSFLGGGGGPAPDPDPGGDSDPHFANVVLLASFDGADGATTATDDSNSGHTLTFNGGAQLDTAQKVFGTAALLLDGSGDLVSVAPSTDWHLEDGDFTIEARVRFASSSGYQAIVSHYDATPGEERQFVWEYRGDLSPKRIRLIGSTDNSGVFLVVQTSEWEPTVGQFYALAVERENGTARLYVDGAVMGEAASTSNFFQSDTSLRIGAQRVSGSLTTFLNGHIDELRFTNGVGRYGGAYTPATEAFPRS